MNCARLFTVILTTVFLTSTAFADSSLPPDVIEIADEGAAVSDEGGAATDPGTNVEIISSDEGSAATDTGSPSTDFSPNPCWDEQCTAESAACQADADCTSFNKCWKKSGEEQQACFLELSEAVGEDAYAAADELHKALRECGWAACNDPNAGSCADPGKDGAANRCGQWDDAWACNCDDACDQFGDCCADMATVCVSQGGSCAGVCGSPDPQGDCYCDEACAQNGDCCSDYEAECSGGSCTPSCDGKQCGSDGCGGSCGTCEGSFECNADAQCVAPSTTTDAGSTSNDAGSSTTTDATTSGDVAAGPGADTGAGTSGSGSSDSGGCAANANASTPWALMLLCVALALGLRRRRSFEV